MASSHHLARHDIGDTGLGKSLMELAPLELECMNMLWPLGEGTVRDIQRLLAASRPRAYTTIMTIMDRLAHKGVVTRRKSGRAWLYRPNLSAEEARTRAVSRVVEGFFEGSATALAAHLAGFQPVAGARQPTRASRRARPRAAAESEAGASPRGPEDQRAEEAREEQVIVVSPTRLDDSLL